MEIWSLLELLTTRMPPNAWLSFDNLNMPSSFSTIDSKETFLCENPARWIASRPFRTSFVIFRMSPSSISCSVDSRYCLRLD